MKETVCPYCGKKMFDDDRSFRFRCAYCKEYLVDIDKDAHRPEVNWKDNPDKKNTTAT